MALGHLPRRNVNTLQCFRSQVVPCLDFIVTLLPLHIIIDPHHLRLPPLHPVGFPRPIPRAISGAIAVRLIAPLVSGGFHWPMMISVGITSPKGQRLQFSSKVFLSSRRCPRSR